MAVLPELMCDIYKRSTIFKIRQIGDPSEEAQDQEVHTLELRLKQQQRRRQRQQQRRKK